MEGIDNTDIKILKILIQNGRASYSYIAKETRLSDVAVKKRVEKLMNRGIIKKISAVVDREKLGYKYTFFVQFRVDPSSVYLVYKRLSSMPNVLDVYIMAGEYPIMAKVVGESLDNLKDFIRNLSKLDGVTDVKSYVVLEYTEKELTLPGRIGQRVLG